MDVGDRHGNGQDGTHRRQDDTKKPRSFGGPSYDILKKNIGFHWKRNKNRSEFYQNLMKIDLRHRQSRFENEELRNRNLDESSQAMSIPGTAGEAAEAFFSLETGPFWKAAGGFCGKMLSRICKMQSFSLKGSTF